jgi:hypothetical protein
VQVSKNVGGEEVLIPVVKFIQSTYEGPSYNFLGDGTDPKSENKKERPRGRGRICSTIQRKFTMSRKELLFKFFNREHLLKADNSNGRVFEKRKQATLFFLVLFTCLSPRT